MSEDQTEKFEAVAIIIRRQSDDKLIQLDVSYFETGSYHHDVDKKSGKERLQLTLLKGIDEWSEYDKKPAPNLS